MDGFELLRHRRRAGWTQRELAERARVNVRTVTRIERGLAVPNVATMTRLADALGVPLAALVMGATDAGAVRVPSGSGVHGSASVAPARQEVA